MTLFARITFIVSLKFCKFISHSIQIDVLVRIQLFMESNSDLLSFHTSHNVVIPQDSDKHLLKSEKVGQYICI